MQKSGLLQGLPGQISLLQLVIGVGGHQDGALALRVHQDVGPAAVALLHHVLEIDALEAVSEKSRPIGSQAPRQGRRNPKRARA